MNQQAVSLLQMLARFKLGDETAPRVSQGMALIRTTVRPAPAGADRPLPLRVTALAPRVTADAGWIRL